MSVFGCASFIYLRELRQYLLVNHLDDVALGYLQTDIVTSILLTLTPIFYIPYLPRIKNMEYVFIYLPYSRFLIRSNRFYSLFTEYKE